VTVGKKPTVAASTVILMVVAGMVFVTSAQTARGTDLRAERAQDLKALVLVRAQDVRREESVMTRIRAQIDELSLEFSSPEIRALRAEMTTARVTAGLATDAGGGLVVTLSDAPHEPGTVAENVDPNWLLVHQEDIQGVINALWAGGATSVSVMDERIISTSPIKCVGSTVLVNGRVFSPPFVIKAIGDPKKLQASLDRDDTVGLFKDLAQTYGLQYNVTVGHNIVMRPYSGVIVMQHAKSLVKDKEQ
jgi:uncharacterized protein YlxW (UPF0749 family)